MNAIALCSADVRRQLSGRVFALCGFCLIAAGCSGGGSGPELVPVTGKVTLDATPLDGAFVEFVPENGSPSIGRTDENGEYSLMYSRDQEGAVLGQHTVRITTHQTEDEDEDGNPIAANPERVPIEYNLRSTLKREVKDDGEPINFELKSGGPIVQPEALRDDDEDS